MLFLVLLGMAFHVEPVAEALLSVRVVVVMMRFLRAGLVVGRPFSGQLFAGALLDDLFHKSRRFTEDDVSLLEILEASSELAGFAGGIPVKTGLDRAQSVGALSDGEFEEAGLLFLGFTPSQVEKRLAPEDS